MWNKDTPRMASGPHDLALDGVEIESQVQHRKRVQDLDGGRAPTCMQAAGRILNRSHARSHQRRSEEGPLQQAKANRVNRKLAAMLLGSEAFFGRGGYRYAIVDQHGGSASLRDPLLSRSFSPGHSLKGTGSPNRTFTLSSDAAATLHGFRRIGWIAISAPLRKRCLRARILPLMRGCLG